MKDVPVQKGPIDPNPSTMKQKSHLEKSIEAQLDNARRKWGQTLEYHEPKK